MADELQQRLDEIMAPVLAERAEAKAKAEAEAAWPGEELVRIVIAVRASQKIHDGSLWDHAVNATCDEFASKLLTFLGQLREKQQARINAVCDSYEAEYAGCPNRYGLTYGE